MSSTKKRGLALVAVLVVLLVAGVIWKNRSVNTGEIYLYGESHSNQGIEEKELEIWGEYYASGMRDLFVEYPYADAQFLNLWMQSDNDDLLEQQFEDWKGTAGGQDNNKNFLKKIKENYPQTVFHGTDIGHTYKTTGPRYLAYLEEHGQKDSEEYKAVQENIEQGRYYYENGGCNYDGGEMTETEIANAVYRENKMAENFERIYNEVMAARKTNIMGIYGGAHTGLDAMDTTNTVPCMGNQLAQTFGERVHSTDLSEYATPTYLEEPLSTETMTINGKEYTASYFGEYDISQFTDYKTRKFWRIEDAYDDLKDLPKTREVLPYNNFPMEVEKGQVFCVEYLKTNGTTYRTFYRSDGKERGGVAFTEAFTVEEGYTNR